MSTTVLCGYLEGWFQGLSDVAGGQGVGVLMPKPALISFILRHTSPVVMLKFAMHHRSVDRRLYGSRHLLGARYVAVP